VLVIIIAAAAVQAASEVAKPDPMAEWKVCVELFSLQYARSPEPAETAATAAMARCQKQESRVEIDFEKKLAPDAGYIDIDRETRREMDELRGILRSRAIADILDERMKPKSH
jgi:hypothetical protein